MNQRDRQEHGTSPTCQPSPERRETHKTHLMNNHIYTGRNDDTYRVHQLHSANLGDQDEISWYCRTFFPLSCFDDFFAERSLVCTIVSTLKFSQLFFTIPPLYGNEGGWKACLKDHQHLLGSKVWFDSHLFRYGAMGFEEIHSKMADWEGYGFVLVEQRDGAKYWADVCIYRNVYNPDEMGRIKCEWLATHKDPFSSVVLGVHLKDTEPGEVVGPTSAKMKKMRRQITIDTFRWNFAMYFMFLSCLAAVFYYIRDNWY